MFLIEKVLFFLLLLLLPTQFGKHFWPSFSLVLGQRIDYLSPTLYVTDILIGLLFLIQIIKFFRNVVPTKQSAWRDLHSRADKKWLFSLFFILVFLSINIFFSLSPIEGLYGLWKVMEVTVLIYYTGNFLRKEPKIFLFPLTFGIISESVLAIAQFFTQGSLNGIFYYLGERTFTSVTPGIANASINGQLLLRPYGTFSHPNVLAGYLVICMTMLIANFKLRIINYQKVLIYISLIIGTIGLFFTLSRAAIFVWVLVCLFLLIRYLRKTRFSKKLLLIANGSLGALVVIIFILTPLLPRFSSLTLQDESVVLREQLTQDAFRMMFARPVFGVGLNNFLASLPHYDFRRGSIFSIQPVHNIFLLIGAETGFIGFWLAISFVIWLYIRLWKQYKKIRHPEFISGSKGAKMLDFIQHDDKRPVLLSIILLTEVVILGSFDHYFLTLQQGQLLLSLVIGYAFFTLKQ